MGRSTVEVKVIVLDVFAVIALAGRQAEGPLFQNRTFVAPASDGILNRARMKTVGARIPFSQAQGQLRTRVRESTPAFQRLVAKLPTDCPECSTTGRSFCERRNQTVSSQREADHGAL